MYPGIFLATFMHITQNQKNILKKQHTFPTLYARKRRQCPFYTERFFPFLNPINVVYPIGEKLGWEIFLSIGLCVFAADGVYSKQTNQAKER